MRRRRAGGALGAGDGLAPADAVGAAEGGGAGC